MYLIISRGNFRETYHKIGDWCEIGCASWKDLEIEKFLGSDRGNGSQNQEVVLGYMVVHFCLYSVGFECYAERGVCCLAGS